MGDKNESARAAVLSVCSAAGALIVRHPTRYRQHRRENEEALVGEPFVRTGVLEPKR